MLKNEQIIKNIWVSLLNLISIKKRPQIRQFHQITCSIRGVLWGGAMLAASMNCICIRYGWPRCFSAWEDTNVWDINRYWKIVWMKIDVEIVKPALRNCRHRCEGALSNRLNATRMMGPLDVKYWLDWQCGRYSGGHEETRCWLCWLVQTSIHWLCIGSRGWHRYGVTGQDVAQEIEEDGSNPLHFPSYFCNSKVIGVMISYEAVVFF